MIIALSRDKLSITGLYFGQKYIRYFKSLGLSIIKIPNKPEKVESYFDKKIGAILLTGGNDINPKKYGDNVDWPDISDKRDQTETLLLDIAIKRKLPVLGICRGMQFINVYFGGKLIRNIKQHPFNVDHTIRITDNKVKDFLEEDNFNVNSYHHQVVTKEVKAKPLKAFAEADLEIIEGLYHPNLPIAGIQWHPERKSPDEEINKKLIEAFIKKELFWKK